MARTTRTIARLTERYPAAMALALLALILASAAACSAGEHQAATPLLEDRVTDLARILPPERRQQLIAELAAFEQETSRQIVVLTVPTLDGEALPAFSLRVANEWGVGRKGHDDGILVTLDLAERQVRIEVGKGLESEITDDKAKQIIDTEMVPAFRQGDYAGGLERGVRCLMAEAPRSSSKTRSASTGTAAPTRLLPPAGPC